MTHRRLRIKGSYNIKSPCFTSLRCHGWMKWLWRLVNEASMKLTCITPFCIVTTIIPWWASNGPFFCYSHVTWVLIDTRHTRRHVFLPLPISLIPHPDIGATDRGKSIGTTFLCNRGCVRLFIEFLSCASHHLAAFRASSSQ